MTTAHRPTFDPAKGKGALSTPSHHQRLQPAHTALKHRQPGQGDRSETQKRDLRAELLKAEAEYLASKGKQTSGASQSSTVPSVKRLQIDSEKPSGEEYGEEDSEARRRRLVLQEAARIDADLESDSSSGSGESDSSESESEDEATALQRELDKIKRERAEKAAAEAAKKASEKEDSRLEAIARGNPLLAPSSSDFGVKKRWDEDVVFRNQARGVDEKNKSKEFVNDLLRSDFHKRFMNKYVR